MRTGQDLYIYLSSRATLRVKYGTHIGITFQVFRALPWCHHRLEPSSTNHLLEHYLFTTRQHMAWRSISQFTLPKMDTHTTTFLWNPPSLLWHWFPSSSRKLIPFFLKEIKLSDSFSLSPIWPFFRPNFRESQMVAPWQSAYLYSVPWHFWSTMLRGNHAMIAPLSTRTR